ncbi:recombinase RecA [Blattabacterium cuenoti]|uniref:Protein RecA n=1 Tax=Blattabacterium cuenoti BPAY TaxID=1457031 RepID=A0ABN5V3F9_9FLAO|nr:recombinase RecA [Blattabacterium cuenoti]BAR91799.1 recombinase A [Blattabacterium cuenoti BPAY]
MNEKIEQKRKSLQLVLEKMDKIYGKGTVMQMGDSHIKNLEVISSGSLSLDIALGIKGFPKGRIIEIFGPESSGKTTLALHAINQSQKLGGFASFIDAEHAFDRIYAQKIGVNIKELIISQPDNGEQALEIVDNLIRSGVIDIIVVDSVAALTPKSEIEGEMGDSKIGLQARLMSQALRKLTSSIGKSKSILIFINQLREKIGVYGNPEVTTGGNALKFYSSIRLDIRKGNQIKNGEKILGNRTKVKVVKNKLSPPFRIAEFDIMYGEGISRIGEILDLGVDLGILKKNASWFSYGDIKLGQGRDSVKEFLKEKENIINEIQKNIYKNI